MMALSLTILCFLLHLVSYAGLGIRGFRPKEDQPQPLPIHISVALLRCMGIVAAILTLMIPMTAGRDPPLLQCSLRVVAFFYTCKILDLVVRKAEAPPRLLGTSEIAKPKSLWAGLARYALLLLVEMRYHRFDIAVTQK